MNWTSVEDKLPENLNTMGRVRVLCHIKHAQSMVVAEYQEVKLYVEGSGFSELRKIGGYKESVTHWMPLPEPPESHE